MLRHRSVTEDVRFRSPDLRADAVAIAVVVPTFKRPDHLVKTLRSLAGQTVSRPFAVVVVENHADGAEGAREAQKVFAAGAPAGIIVIEPRQGNCNAYNAGFAAALGVFPNLEHVAIIDDDEVAAPRWLEFLLEASNAGADVVGGPHVPIFEDDIGERIYGRHPVFRSPQRETGAVDMLTSTGNCMISAEVLRSMAPHLLDERFNFLGGGDTDFFTRCRDRGFSFGWHRDAIVYETVPRRRTERSWITARSVRNGIISTIIQRRRSPGVAGRLRVVAKSLALLGASPLRSVLLALRTGSLYIGSYHMMVAAGRLLAEFGYSIEQYREPEKN